MERIEEQVIQPLLADDDWAGAAIAAANAYREEIGADGGGGVPGWVWIGGAAVVAGGGYWAYRRSRRPRVTAPASADELAQLSTEDLGKRANALLVETDDAVKTSEQEVGFAEAQFGSEPVAEFRTSVDTAKQELAAAFALRQRLDDENPDSEQDQRAIYTEIVQRLTAANQALDDHAEDFDRLRDLEKTIDTELPKLDEVATSIEGRIPKEQARLEALRSRFAPTALATVNDNIAQAPRPPRVRPHRAGRRHLAAVVRQARRSGRQRPRRRGSIGTGRDFARRDRPTRRGPASRCREGRGRTRRD